MSMYVYFEIHHFLSSITFYSLASFQVRFEDQQKINEFGKLNNRLLEIRADIGQLKQDVEKLDDATTELAMAVGGKVMLFMGESFVETTEDYANECKFYSINHIHYD